MSKKAAASAYEMGRQAFAQSQGAFTPNPMTSEAERGAWMRGFTDARREQEQNS